MYRKSNSKNKKWLGDQYSVRICVWSIFTILFMWLTALICKTVATQSSLFSCYILTRVWKILMCCSSLGKYRLDGRLGVLEIQEAASLSGVKVFGCLTKCWMVMNGVWKKSIVVFVSFEVLLCFGKESFRIVPAGCCTKCGIVFSEIWNFIFNSGYVNYEVLWFVRHC